jgi:predicted dehydrogenase
MKRMRLGIIGLGDVATAHLAAIPLVPAAELVSVCDISSDLAESVADSWGARAYSDPLALLADGGIDLVMILTPASTHRALVEAAADSGVDVFCEKPLAITLQDGAAMISACDAAGVRLFQGLTYRYMPAIRKAYELINSGAVGRVQLMTEQMIGGHGLAGYRQWSQIHYPHGGPGGPGMSLIDHGFHLIDIFSWFVGRQPVQVIGKGQISGAPADSEYLIMTYPCGAVGHLLYNNATFSAGLPNEGMFSGGAGWTTDGSMAPAGTWIDDPGSISVYGTEGTLRIFHYCNALFLNTGSGPKRVELQGRAPLGHFATQLEACLAAIADNLPPPVSGHDGMAALRTLLSAYR